MDSSPSHRSRGRGAAPGDYAPPRTPDLSHAPSREQHVAPQEGHSRDGYNVYASLGSYDMLELHPPQYGFDPYHGHAARQAGPAPRQHAASRGNADGYVALHDALPEWAPRRKQTCDDGARAHEPPARPHFAPRGGGNAWDLPIAVPRTTAPFSERRMPSTPQCDEMRALAPPPGFPALPPGFPARGGTAGGTAGGTVRFQQERAKGGESARLPHELEGGRVGEGDEHGEEVEEGPSQEEVIRGVDASVEDSGACRDRIWRGAGQASGAECGPRDAGVGKGRAQEAGKGTFEGTVKKIVAKIVDGMKHTKIPEIVDDADGASDGKTASKAAPTPQEQEAKMRGATSKVAADTASPRSRPSSAGSGPGEVEAADSMTGTTRGSGAGSGPEASSTDGRWKEGCAAGNGAHAASGPMAACAKQAASRECAGGAGIGTPPGAVSGTSAGGGAAGGGACGTEARGAAARGAEAGGAEAGGAAEEAQPDGGGTEAGAEAAAAAGGAARRGGTPTAGGGRAANGEAQPAAVGTANDAAARAAPHPSAHSAACAARARAPLPPAGALAPPHMTDAAVSGTHPPRLHSPDMPHPVPSPAERPLASPDTIPNGALRRDAQSADTIDLPYDLADDKLPPGQGLSGDILDAVVKIYATHCDPNYSLPWQMRRQTQSTSSGFVISGRRILTNAHSVEHYTVVRVKKRAGDHKYIARVLATGNECDLALLTVEDETFWADLSPLPFGALPELQTSVIVVGYPIGGENISVTAGVVSRVEIQEYTHGASQLLGIQIDAAINSGSSGGPALNHRNEVVGIAFQSLNTGDSENIGYLVAESVVDHFLRDYERNGRYTGFCHCGFAWQKMENAALRRCMNMKPHDSGILVRRVMKTSPAQAVLKQGDIVTSIDDVSISNAGTVPYRSGERISFHYIITTKFTGDMVKLNILRDGEYKTIEYELRDSSENLLVPVHEHRRQPEYFTIAGLVFVALSEPYLAAEYGDKWDLKAPVRLLERLMYGSKEYLDEQVVVLSQVLNAEINIEYECVINTRVHKFNGVKLRNLAHLAKLVDACTDDFLRFDLDDEIVVVGREEALKASAEILETHCIPSACSIGELPHVGEETKNEKSAESVTDDAKEASP